jgi:uncharacterized protein (TIGR03086 family)
MGTEENEAVDVQVLARRVIDLTTGVIANIGVDQLSNQTPCAEWAVSDVLDHITNGAAMFAMSVGPASVPDDLMARVKAGGDYEANWKAATAAAMASAAQPGALEKTVTLPFGEMTAGAFLNYVIFDLTTHATDIARATGQSIADTALLETALEVGRRTVGPQLRQPGVFDPEQPVPADAPVIDRLQAFAGRSTYPQTGYSPTGYAPRVPR